MKGLLRDNRDLFFFLVKLGALCSFYFLWFSPRVWQLPVISTYYGHYVHYTLLILAEGSVWVLNLLGYGAEVVNQRNIDLYDTVFGLHIKNYCLGIDMMFTLTALIVSFPGKWLDRLWFIPLGIVGIQIINIVRVVGLCISWLRFDNIAFVDHHTVFNILAVTFIFLLFRAWVKRYRKKNLPLRAGSP